MKASWKVILAFVGVFMAGAICSFPLSGWMRDLQGKRLSFAERTTRRLEKQLELTPVQTEKIQPIIMRTEGEYRRLRQEDARNFTGMLERMHEDIAVELTQEQRAKLTHIRDEFRDRAERLRSRSLNRDR
jgi:hypothetical protein